MIMGEKITNTDIFVKKAKEKYGEEYTYEKTNYVNYRTKLIVTDKNGKDILIYPAQFLKRFKNANKKYNTETFIERAKEIYGNKYKYEKTICNKSNDKVIITCPEHGDFVIVAYAFLNGHGCKYCNNRYNTEKFINAAKKIHGDKYDYSKVVYINSSTKICIICPEHGEFWQLPTEHLKGAGCEKCAREKNKLKLDEFVNRSVKFHGDKYDYSKVIYNNSNEKICIICPEHGEFWQRPIKHLIGQGCPICGGITISKKLSLTQNEFIEKAKKIHSDRYDYSKINYVNSATKVCIICPEHGEFWQTPHSHISGQGCPFCKESKGERKIKQFLENNNIEYEQQKMFNWLVYENPMKLDFYLPKYNVGIEFQGEQHFSNKKWWNTTDENKINEYFSKTIERDVKKNKLCKENGVELFYITDHNFKGKYNGIYDKYHTSKSIKKIVDLIKKDK